MKLTTKRDRWYFWREVFSYMIPMIMIVGVVDVFFNFMQCSVHPEWSAPCKIIWINAAGYGVFLIITIIFAIFSARKLRKIKKRIENEFLEVASQAANKSEDKTEKVEEKSDKVENADVKKPKKIIVKADKKESIKKTTKKETKESAKSSEKKKSVKKKTSSKK